MLSYKTEINYAIAPIPKLSGRLKSDKDMSHHSHLLVNLDLDPQMPAGSWWKEKETNEVKSKEFLHFLKQANTGQVFK